MANICCFDMHVSGKKQNIRTLFDWMRAKYDYKLEAEPKIFIVEENGTKKPADVHLGYRIFDCDICDKYEMGKAKDDDNIVIAFSGSCANSCAGCMLVDGYKPEHNVISLPEACEKLGLDVELFSEESGCQFSEHIVVNSDGTWTKDSVPLVSLSLSDYDSYKELKADLPEGLPYFSELDYDTAKEEDEDTTVVLCEHFAWQDPYDWPWSF